MATEQLNRILDSVPDVPPDGDSQPRMPFKTAYQITREQEDELIEHAMRRLEDLEPELGRDTVELGDWWKNEVDADSDAEGKRSAERTFLGKRKIFDLTYRNDVQWRQNVLGGIFRESNLVAPVSRRITRQMVARAISYYFGTDPWFAAYPVGDLDRVRANKIDRYARWKMDQAKLKSTGERAVERAFTVGEAVVKTTWKRKDSFHKTHAEVMVGENGEPILDANGDFITKDDRFAPYIVQDDMGVEVDTGAFVLERDGQTIIPPEPAFEERLIERRIISQNGPHAAVVNTLDFLCPLDAPTIQEADCCIHLYDLPVMELAESFIKEREAGMTAGAEAARKTIEMIRAISNDEAGEAWSSAEKGYRPDVDNHEDRDHGREKDPIINIAEFHLRYDADGDGIMEEIMLVLDRRTKTPIFYDYEANITPDGQRPFEVLRLNPIEGCWYGLGSMEMFDTTQKIIDLLLNRWNFANGAAARVDFWSPQNTVEGRNQPNLELNGGYTYTPLPGKRAEDCLESVQLVDLKSDGLRELFELFIQMAMNESGVQHANDAGVSGMDSTKLATGIRNIEKNAQEMFSLYLGHLEPGVTGLLDRMVCLLYANMDEEEVFTFFEEGEDGGEGAFLVERLTPEEVQQADIHVRMLMTRYRGEQIIESSLRAWEIVEKYYMSPPMVQERVTPMVREMLKAFQVSKVDEVIQPLPPDPMMEGGGGGGTRPINAQESSMAAATPPRRAPENL